MRSISSRATRVAVRRLGLVAAMLASAGLAPAQDNPSHDLARIRSIAASQHEIVMILIGKKDYGQAVSEAGKIFGMNWPADQEPVLLKELLLFADKLLHEQQARFGLQLLENNEKTFRSITSRVAILKEKGYLHKELNDGAKALECFREAQRLEQSAGSKPQQ